MTSPRAIAGLVYSSDDVVPTILNPVTGQIFVTNEVGKRLLELCDGSRDVDALVAQIAAEFAGCSVDQARADVVEFLSRAVEQRLAL
ncbi:MAG: PqqD family protein [Vicinamibacterales bacterium]|jgi:hypothetical protein